MAIARDLLSRREFLRAASVLASVAATAGARTMPDTPRFPYVDGLCLEVFQKPEEIRASGLSALVFDVSEGETIPDCDGAPKWRRTFSATSRSIAAAREKLQQTPDVFLATDGRQVREAFKSGKTAVFFQIQGGGEIVEQDLSRIDLLHGLGLRVLQITHHHDNPFGGGGVVRNPRGLTPLGIEAVERMNALGIIPDLSHSSDQTGADTLRVSKKPVIVSHGAARAIVNNARCTPDSVIRGVADSGGVMGIFMMSFWLTTEAVPTVEAYVRQIRHVVKVAGIDAAGISNDFPLAGERGLVEAKGDNAVAIKNYLAWWESIGKLGVLGFDKTPTHVAIPELNTITRMHLIHEALVKAGFTATEREKIMGGNWIRVLSS